MQRRAQVGHFGDTGTIRCVYASAPTDVVAEIVELELPARLRWLRPAFNAYNKALHVDPGPGS